jgi:hypothetical protein
MIQVQPAILVYGNLRSRSPAAILPRRDTLGSTETAAVPAECRAGQDWYGYSKAQLDRRGAAAAGAGGGHTSHAPTITSTFSKKNRAGWFAVHFYRAQLATRRPPPGTDGTGDVTGPPCSSRRVDRSGASPDRVTFGPCHVFVFIVIVIRSNLAS